MEGGKGKDPPSNDGPDKSMEGEPLSRRGPVKSDEALPSLMARPRSTGSGGSQQGYCPNGWQIPAEGIEHCVKRATRYLASHPRGGLTN